MASGTAIVNLVCRRAISKRRTVGDIMGGGVSKFLPYILSIRSTFFNSFVLVGGADKELLGSLYLSKATA